MSSKYLSITTLYTDAQVNIEQFNKILEEKLSWFQEVQETAVKLFGSKTCTLLPKTPSMKRKRPFQKQSELTENSISLNKHSTFVDDLQMHKKIRIDISDIEEKSMLEESLNKSSTDYSSRLRNRKKKSSLAKKKPKRAVTKTSKSYFESPWNANDNKNSSTLASMINTSLQTFSSPSKNSNTQQKAVLVIEKLNLSSKTAKTTKEDYSLKNSKDMVKQALFVENPNKGQEVESLIQSDIVKNIPSKSSSPQLYHTSFSIVVEKLTTPKQLNTQSSSPEHTNSNKESTPIEKINGSSKLAKSKLFISINDQLDANIDSSIQKNYCHANSPLTLSPSISPSVSVEDKGSFHPNRTLVLSPSKSLEDKRPLHASVENESPLDSNPTEVLSPPILHETQYSCFVKPQSPPRSPMTTDKIDKNSNIQSLPFPSQSEQVVGYHSIQIPNNTQDKYDYTMLTNKENKTETDENVNESDQDPVKCKNDCSEASSDNCDCSQDNEKNETKMVKVTKPGTNILSDINSLIKQDMTKEPTNLVRIGNIVSAGIKSFMKNQDSPKKETIEEKQQKKHAELKKRDELRQKVIEEQFLKKQKEKEDRKRQREEREKRFAEQIARRQEEEAKRKEQMILKLKQASQNRDEVRKQRELEEVKKRKQRDIKMAEAEARRQKEEEELKKKAIEAREEEKRREEALKIKFELEEQERQRRKIEQEKAEKDRLRQIEEERALDSDRKRREFAERENHRQEVEKKMKEDREKEKIEKQLREEKNKLAEKDIAQGKKHELDRDKLKEKLREDIKLEIQNEKQAKSNLFSGQVSVNAQNLTMKTLHVHVDDVEKLKPPNALMPFIKSPAAFREQPSTWKPPTIPLVVQDTSYISYGLDLDSDDSTDDECEPSKAVPMWAQGINLKRQLMQQFYTDVDPELIFINAMPPCSLEKIFQKRKERYFKRTSSAHWTSPILKAKVF